MMNQWRYLLGLLLPLLLACSRAGVHEALFKQVENIVNERPDSAMVLLERIEQPETLPDAEWHWGALLWTQAKDKLFIRHTSDSLINSVVAYYDTHGDNLQKALAYYYKGRVNNDLGRLKEATTAYLTASGYAKETSDVNLNYGILSQIGTLYAHKNMTNEALDVYKQALVVARQAGDSTKIAFSYAYLGRIYGEKNEWDKADSCYQYSIQISRSIHNYRTLRLGMQELSAVYTEQGRLDEALFLAKQLKDFENMNGLPPNGGRLFVIGDIYRKLHQLDSAYFYLSQAMGSGNIYTRRSAYGALSDLFREKNRHEEAGHFDQLYHAVSDSIEAMGTHSDIRHIKDQFGWEEREAFRFKIHLAGSVIGLVLIVIILFMSRRYLKERKGREAEQEKRKKVEDKKCRLEERLLEAERKLEKSEDLLTVRQENLSGCERKIAQIETDLRASQDELKESKIEINRWKAHYQNLKTERKQLEENVVRNVDEWLLESPNRVKLLLNKLRKSPRVITKIEKQGIRTGTEILYPHFLKRLKEKHGKLTEDDLLIACLIRLDFTDKENLACVLNIQKDSFKKRISRMRGKFLPIRLEAYEDLIAYIQDFPQNE